MRRFAGGSAPTDKALGLLHSILGCSLATRNSGQKPLKWFERAVHAGADDGLIEIAKIHLRYAGDRAAGLRYLKLAVAAKDRLTKPARLETERALKEQKALSSA